MKNLGAKAPLCFWKNAQNEVHKYVCVFLIVMSRTHVVKFFVSESQYEIIITNARIAGFKTVAAYARHMTFDYVPEFEKRVVETNKLVKQIIKIIGRGDVIGKLARLG